MPTVEISSPTFRKLQELAEPFVDTPEDVIRRLVDAAIQSGDSAKPEETGPLQSKGPRQAMMIDPEHPEDLTHTRILKARIDGEPVPRPKWNGLVHLMHVRALRRLESVDAVMKVTKSNVRVDEFTERGFVFLPEAGISIQGVEARLAWESVLRLAQTLNIPVEVEFEWHSKEKAAHPGVLARMSWSPDGA